MAQPTRQSNQWLKQEGKHQFLRDLSRNVSRGQISNAQRGLLCGQSAPYGYDRMLVDESGTHRQRVRNGESFSKARSWRTTLVPSDDAIKVATVKSLFEDYANTDVGLRSLADRQRENAQAQLRAFELASDPQDASGELDAVLARLTRMGTDLVEAEPARRREVFRELIDRVELRFDKKPRGKRVECPLQSGLIHLRTGEGSIFGCVSREFRGPVELFLASVAEWEAHVSHLVLVA